MERISTDLDADAPMLALHFWKAGDALRTWLHARRAGEEARRAYANVDAADQFERALEVSRRVPGVTDADRAAIWAIVGELRELAGVLDGSIDAFRRAEALTPDRVGRAELIARRARVHERAGQYPDGPARPSPWPADSSLMIRSAGRPRLVRDSMTSPPWSGSRRSGLGTCVGGTGIPHGSRG